METLTGEVLGSQDVGAPIASPAKPTVVQYSALQCISDHFDRTLIEPLFGVKLPYAMITMQRRAHVQGFFLSRQFTLSNSEELTDEIALNPKYFHLLGARDICATLVHEKLHQLQFYYGKPMKNGYHDRQWGAAMKMVGLWPSHTGKPGGRETGVHMADYVIEGGPFALAFEELDATIAWGDVLTKDAEKPSKPPKRIKFVCPRCDFTTMLVPSAAGRLGCIPCGGGSVALVAA